MLFFLDDKILLAKFKAFHETDNSELLDFSREFLTNGWPVFWTSMNKFNTETNSISILSLQSSK